MTQCGLIDIGLSDHQMIFCTAKIKKENVGGHTQISCRSFKNYSVDKHENAPAKVTFPNYEKYIQDIMIFFRNSLRWLIILQF